MLTENFHGTSASSVPPSPSCGGVAGKIFAARQAAGQAAKAVSNVDEWEGIDPIVRSLLQALRMTRLPSDPEEQETPPSSRIVQVDFDQDEVPLGLLMDWSLAMPIVVQVEPGSPADERGCFSPGMALVVVGRTRLHPGQSREQIEGLLRPRPLSLFFEVPDTDRFAEVSTSLLALQLQASSRIPGEMETTMSATMRSHGSWPRSRRQDPMAGERSMVPDIPPERSPLSRFAGAGRRAAMPSYSLMLPLIQPRVFAGGMYAHGFQAWGQSATGRAPSPVHSTHLTATKSSQQQQQQQMQNTAGFSATGSSWRRTTGSSPWLPFGTGSLVDPCYEHLVSVEEDARTGVASHATGTAHSFRPASAKKGTGPGPSTRWPMLHGEGYTCVLVDMCLAARIRDAYEVGFRGSKRQQPVALRVSALKIAESAVARPSQHHALDEIVEEPVRRISCDICGNELIGPSTNESIGVFYYCKQCKRNGKRFEMCPGCHNCEILQAEGKFCFEDDMHPHFTTCSHHGLVRRKGLHAAHPHAPHLRRAFCDLCGKVAAVRERDNEFYVCPRCPEDNGLRFEMCATCATDLLGRGWGAQRLRHLSDVM